MNVALKPEKCSNPSQGRLRKGRRFYLGHLPLADTPLAVVGGGHEFCRPNFPLSRDCGDFHALEFVARGRGWLTLDGNDHPLAAGAVFSRGPGLSHSLATEPPDPPEKYFVEFTGPLAPQILADHGLAPGTVARLSSVGEVEDIFDNLIRDGSRATGASNLLCGTLAQYLLIKIADLVVPPGAPPSAASATFHRCRQYITRHFHRLRSLEQIAEECRIDQAYLCRLFRRFGHQAPYRYLLRLKMKSAADQLRDPNVLVKEVAANIGFEDPFQFSHAFKNIFGASPDLFRRLQKQ
jgi:AraC-like DNA-binding protein